MRAVATRSRRERKRARAVEVAAYDQPAKSMVAAAVGVKAGHSFQNLKLGGTDWQQEGWLHYDSCPEFHAAVQIIAFNLSRARLFGVDVDPVTGQASTEPTDDPDVADIMAQFFGGPAGQSQALDRLGRHLTVAGDTWVLATDEPDQDDAAWQILATTEVTGSQGRIMVTELNGQPRPVDTDQELLMRIWRPHPKRRQEADAVTRSALPVLRELAALSAMVSGTVKSRLASSGILWLPDELTLPAPADPSTDDGAARSMSMGADGWLELITEAMTAPIKDPDSAAAVVPLVAVVQADMIEKIKHMEFGRDLDSTIEPLRQACIKRIAVVMDMPPEVLLGMGGANHWGAWSITEEFAKAFLSPLLELIVDAATQFYLRRALRAIGRDPALFAVGFDLSALFPRQMSVDNAQAAFNAGLLSEKAYMAALGFGEAEMADSTERGRRIVEEMVRRGIAQTIQELAPALHALYPGLVVAPMVGPTRQSTTETITPTQPRTEPTPTVTAPAPPARPPAQPPAGGAP